MKFAAIDRVALSQIGFNLFSRNAKMIGASQHGAVPVAPLQPVAARTAGADQTVNFSDLLNLFAFRPDLNIGATIKALQERNLLQILAEPNLITVEGKEATFLAGGSFPVSHHHHHADRRRHRARHHRAVQAVRREAGFHADGDAAGLDRSQSGAGSERLDYANAVTLQGFLIPALSQRRAETEVILQGRREFRHRGTDR